MPEEERAQYGLKPEGIERTALEWSRENVIERTLLRQEAERQGEAIEGDEVEKGLAQLRNRSEEQRGERRFLLTKKLLAAEIETRVRLDRLLGKITARAAAPQK